MTYTSKQVFFHTLFGFITGLIWGVILLAVVLAIDGALR